MTRPVLARTAACPTTRTGGRARAALGTVLLLLVGTLPTLGAGTAHATGAGPSPKAARSAKAVQTPLAVTIETLSPSVLPQRGRVTVTGEVTNRSDDTWTDVQVYLVTSPEPMTTREELAAAADTDEATEIGGRITTPGLFDEVGDLDPGETTSYTVSVPRQDLEISGAPGAYWVGTHALGAVDGIREGVAGGRARTFMPLVERRAPRAEVALVVPLRDRVRRDADGRLLGEGRWQRLLGPNGRLDRLVDLAADNDGALTWLLDPAVLDAAAGIAEDNPPLFTGDDGTGPPEEGGEPTPSPSASPSATDGDAGTGGGEGSEPTVAAQDASAWLEDFRGQVGGDTVMALPYGDVDVAAVTGNRLGRILRRAQKVSRGVLGDLGITATPVVAPPSGFLPPRSLAALDAETPVVMSDQAFPEHEGPLVVRPDGTDVALTDSAASSGGPGPNPRTDPLALRQRILAEAALHAMAPGAQKPLVVTTPQRWNPGPAWVSADFFGGLDVPWLDQVELPDLVASTTPTPQQEPPVYPDEERELHVPFANQLATQELVETGVVFADLLTRNDSVRQDLAGAAMLGSSYNARSHPGPALTRTRNTTLRVRRAMQKVTIDGPPFVMMSSETGPIAVTVVNNLDEPVTVRLQARTPDDELTISSPDPILLGPGQRTPVRMRADSTTLGVHSVTLQATTEHGRPLGSQVQFNVRTSNVGLVIWLIMGTGAAILLVMIGIRIRRRVHAHRAERSAHAEPSAPADQPATPADGSFQEHGA